MAEGYVYRIIAPGSNSVYVGQSTKPLQRLKRHRTRPGNPALSNFLKKHPDAEIYFWPVLDMDAEEIADEQLCREMGFHLLNCAPCGGRPMVRRGFTLSEEHRARISLGLKLSTKVRSKIVGRKCSPEGSAKLSAARKGRKISPEALAKRIGRKLSPEHRAKLSAALKGRTRSPERQAN